MRSDAWNELQTPEWKKAYIDYRGLKKRITAIRKAEQGIYSSSSPDEFSNDPETPPETPRISSAEVVSNGDHGTIGEKRGPFSRRTTSKSMDQAFSSALEGSTSGGRRPSILGRTSFHRQPKSLSSRLGGASGKPTNPLAALPLNDVLLQLSPQENAFFTMLDAQLEKVESFYLNREKEALARAKMLETQLQELTEHRKIFLQGHTKVPWGAAFASLRAKRRNLKITRTLSASECKSTKSTVRSGHRKRPALGFLTPPTSIGKRVSSTSSNDSPIEEDKEDQSGASDDPSPGIEETLSSPTFSTDPDTYLYAKRKLKKAVIEHYRGLELLHNYRILNITGFRKALKKFEKVTRIPIQNQYMVEKIEKSAFASDKVVTRMMREMEEMYANTFVKGNKKKAMKRLRGGARIKSHHFSTFRSGILLGLALPALISGFVSAFQDDTQHHIPGWPALMVVYSALFIPTFFAALVGLNVLVWAHSRINYIFIFELNTTSAMDFREYFEMPSMLLAGLAYCFWLSFARIGAPIVSPTVWPLVWLGGTGLIMLNPFPILFHHTRFWLMRVIAKLFLSGIRRVEFTDFWIGDQFCSLVYTLSNLWFMGCVYADGFSPNWRSHCGTTSKYWPAAFVLAVLPFVLRLIQSIKRFHDSGLMTHLINGGKYGAGIVSYLFLYIWRHYGAERSGALFAFWCIVSTIYTFYACTWDFLMDWSVLKIHSPHALLRPELVYSNHVPFYYAAIAMNILLRFTWVIYIPQKGPDMLIRSFIVAVLEVLRRWQWNFYRLENEHLGNMDQYRVTREVPLPYLFDDPRREEDADDDDDDDEDAHLKK